jgi:hypothetical protein
MNYKKWGTIGGVLLAGYIILALIFGGSGSSAISVCDQSAVRDLVEQIAESYIPPVMRQGYIKRTIDWSTVGGRPNPRDSNIFICAVRGTSFGKIPASPGEGDRFGMKDAAPVGFSVEYTVTLMGKQIEVRELVR